MAAYCLTGDETGLVKVWDISKKSGATCSFSYGAQSRSRGIAAMSWVDGTTSQVLVNSRDGLLSLFDVREKLVLSTVRRGVVAATANGLSVIDGKAVICGRDGLIQVCEWDTPNLSKTRDRTEIQASGPVEAVAVQRKHGLVLVGGRENDLAVWDVRSERTDVPLFKAANVQDHVLGVPYPVYVVGGCFVTPSIYGVCTAYHDVRFYDRRVSERPVQDFKIDREISRRPTGILQWNCNKYVISEASGDVHLYDTRRGFTSRAKLRGGVGSVRSMVKHPSGHQLLGCVGLDRKARIYHVPTGRLLQSIYLKQKADCILFSQGIPFQDERECYAGTRNGKVPERTNVLRDDFWDDMDPVRDEFEDDDGAEGDVNHPDNKLRQPAAAASKGQRKSDAGRDPIAVEELPEEDDGAACFIGPQPPPNAYLEKKAARAARRQLKKQKAQEEAEAEEAEAEEAEEIVEDAEGAAEDEGEGELFEVEPDEDALEEITKPRRRGKKERRRDRAREFTLPIETFDEEPTRRQRREKRLRGQA